MRLTRQEGAQNKAEYPNSESRSDAPSWFAQVAQHLLFNNRERVVVGGELLV